MKTRMSQTSLEAYAKTVESLARQEREVYDAMTKLPFPSNRDVAASLGMEPSTVAGRTNSLVKDGFLTVGGKKVDNRTQMSVCWYEVVA